MQTKLFRDAFKAAGMDVKSDLIPVDIRVMTTDEAVARIQKALDETK
jgi:hypothetical protein